MLNADDKDTFHSIRLLLDTLRQSGKPLLFWFGAGVSKWCEYPLWRELAENLHSELLKYESGYNREQGLSLMGVADYPNYFGICKKNFPKRYFRFLSTTFGPKRTTSVYGRFTKLLNDIEPLYIITTNVDEKLETALKNVRIVQRTDIEYCLTSIATHESFVCKIHGSISSISSLVFTYDEYENLKNDQNYLELLKYIFSLTTVVFLGYGLGDEYVIKTMLENEVLKQLFGDGPHFAVLPETKVTLPPSTRIISYIPEPYRDHRSSIQILEEIKISISTGKAEKSYHSNQVTKAKLTSSHLLSHIYPPGTWTSSVNLQLKINGSESTRFAVVGNGFDNVEFPVIPSKAMHDIIVGLLCFDVVYCPLSALNRVHNLIGSNAFWDLVRNGCLKFIEWKTQEGIIFPNSKARCGGDLGSLEVYDKYNKEKTIQDTIKSHISATPGKERTANELFSLLEYNTKVVTRSNEPSIPNLVRGLLLRPALRKMIGMSGGVQTSSIPQWMKFPVLRLANVVKIAAACQFLGIASTKLEFGTASLAGLAFSTTSGKILTDEMACYVLTGRFDMDLGRMAIANDQILYEIIRFRETQAGESLRCEILEQLSLGLGSDLVASINGGLSSVISLKTLQAAKDKFSGLNIPKVSETGSTTLVWNDIKFEENAMNLWRRRCEYEFDAFCKEDSIQPYDLCPCGSGEKVKFCCKETLRS